MMSSLTRTLLVFALSLFVAKAQATLLDWSTVSWTAGSLSNSYDIDPSHAGNDVTITVSGNTAQLQTEIVSPFPQTPAITSNFQGGLANPVSTLNLALNLTNQTEAVTFTLNFSALYAQGVNNVSFQLFDVDFAAGGGSNYEDQIRNITALSIDGTTMIAPTITISPNNSLSGSGFSQVVSGTTSTTDLGAGSGAANVTIDFGSAAIQSLTFTYGSGTGTVADPTYQHIGIYDIDFAVVPEVDTTFLTILFCAAAIALTSWQRARKSRRLSAKSDLPEK
jgi:hypothetical protein